MTDAQKAGRTPGPWKLFHYNSVIAIKSSKPGPKNEIVFWTGFDSSHYPKQALANAAFIVEACNSHEAGEPAERIRPMLWNQIRWWNKRATVTAGVSERGAT